MEKNEQEKLKAAQSAENPADKNDIKPEDKPGILKFLPPETPEEFYTKGESYLTGAKCAVPFQERAAYLSKAAEMFAGAGDYRDAARRSREYEAMAAETLEHGYAQAYEEACLLKKHASHEEDYFKASRAFERIAGYKDADKLAAECEKKLNHIHARKLPLTLGVIALVIALIAGLVLGAQTDSFRYRLGNAACAVGLDSVGSVLYSVSHDYADSTERLAHCYYREAKRALKRNDLDGAVSRFVKMESIVKNSAVSQFEEMESELQESAGLKFEAECELLKAAQSGSEVYYGQSKWIVLSNEDGKVLLLASSPLAQEAYSDCYDPERDARDLTESQLSLYLNGSYTDVQFNSMELDAIAETSGVDAYVFLLSVEEYEQYFDIITSDDFMSKTDWWLRDMGSVEGTAACVAWDGTVNEAGCAMDSTTPRVRPAIVVNVQE